MIFYGTKASRIGATEIIGTVCQHCDQAEPQHLSVFGKYAHIYWIPFFPIGKKAVSECTSCLVTISQEEFPNSLKQQYSQQKKELKTPIWHWAGLGIIGLLFLYINLIQITKEVDPRSQLLQADMEALTTNPLESDSTSTTLKMFFNDFANEEIEPADFEYMTKIEADKALIIVKIPNLKQVVKESREQVIEMVEMVATLNDSLKDKALYIGIHGRYTFMLVKTPTEFENSRLASDKALLEFYGPIERQVNN